MCPRCTSGASFLPQQQCADSQHCPAGKKQHNLGSLYDTRKESVHHMNLLKLALQTPLPTDLATGRWQSSPTRCDLQFSRPQSKCAQGKPSWECFEASFYWALQLSTGSLPGF